MKIKKLLFVLTLIIALNMGMIVGICGDEVENPDPWSVEPTEITE